MFIRKAQPEDFPLIRDLALAAGVHTGSVSPIRDPEEAAAHMRAHYAELGRRGLAAFPEPWGAEAWVAVDDAGELVGYLLLATAARDDLTGEPQAYVLDVMVASHARGRRVASRLLEQAEAQARARGLRYIGLTVATDNTPALSLYRKLGYVEEWKRLAKRL